MKYVSFKAFLFRLFIFVSPTFSVTRSSQPDSVVCHHFSLHPLSSVKIFFRFIFVLLVAAYQKLPGELFWCRWAITRVVQSWRRLCRVPPRHGWHSVSTARRWAGSLPCYACWVRSRSDPWRNLQQAPAPALKWRVVLNFSVGNNNVAVMNAFPWVYICFNTCVCLWKLWMTWNSITCCLVLFLNMF